MAACPEHPPEGNKRKRPSRAGKRAQAYCFTYYSGGSLSPEEWLCEWHACDMPPQIKFLIGQLEKCPESGRLHVQGYVELHNGCEIPAVQQMLDLGKSHMEKRRKTSAEAAAYCEKEESWVAGSQRVCRGERSQQGKRTDLSAMAAMVMAAPDVGLQQVMMADPSAIIRYGRGLQLLNGLAHPPRVRGRPWILYLVGPSRCGKSVLARTLAPDAYRCSDSPNGWFDGYAGQDTVIFSEFAGKMPVRDLLQIIDSDAVRVWIKGSSAPLRATRFIFTSNYRPELLYTNPLDSDPWLKRIEEFGIIMEEDAIRREVADRRVVFHDSEPPVWWPRPEGAAAAASDAPTVVLGSLEVEGSPPAQPDLASPVWDYE